MILSIILTIATPYPHQENTEAIKSPSVVLIVTVLTTDYPHRVPVWMSIPGPFSLPTLFDRKGTDHPLRTAGDVIVPRLSAYGRVLWGRHVSPHSLSFFLSWVANTQLHHQTNWVVSHRRGWCPTVTDGQLVMMNCRTRYSRLQCGTGVSPGPLLPTPFTYGFAELH